MSESTDSVAARSAPTPSGTHRDGGFTLIEVIIVLVILGIVMSSLSLALSVALRTNPDNQSRIDDARATRSLATWLSYDVSSTPPFVGETAQGGMVTGGTANDCGGPLGSNLLDLKWVEAKPTAVTYVASYRFVQVNGIGEIVRVSCKRLGPGPDPFESTSIQNLTSGLKASAAPTVVLAVVGTGPVTKVSFSLTGNTGQSVLVETASRNPADFFPVVP